MLYQESAQFIKNQFFPKSLDSKRSTLNLEAIVGSHLRDMDAKKDPGYYGHQPGVVHVTSLSGCLRGTVLRLLGATPNEDKTNRQLGVFHAGNLFEDFIISSLGSRVLEKQREYRYQLDGITLVGRSDYLIKDGDVYRIGENKSVHSDAFWHRQKSGELIAWQNQLQLQTYMWLERVLSPFRCEACGKTVLVNDGSSPVCSCKAPNIPMRPAPKITPDGVFTYISKDDCSIVSCPIKFNQEIIDNCVLPAVETIRTAYLAGDATLAPLPEPVAYSESNKRWEKNFLASYCDFHEQCSPGWREKAGKEVARLNFEAKTK